MPHQPEHPNTCTAVLKNRKLQLGVLATGSAFLLSFPYFSGISEAKETAAKESLGHSATTSQAADKLSFNKDVRPILNKNCTICHGGVKKAGEVSFIYREEALGKGKSGKTIIVPGSPEKSEFYRRITTSDPDDVMPPSDGHGKPLTKEEIAIFKRWIEEGAEWEEHWAYIHPRKHALPELKQKDWPTRSMDRFVLARLEGMNLKPSPEASKAEWLRRASLDIIGLPPTAAELKAFEANQAPDAYEKEVDRLLASPHYGERWAAMWLDLARYADTKGYEKDPHRNIWPYRDWLIDAFNANKPYTNFIKEQLAGDQIEPLKVENLVATGFHRNTQTNTEGGTDDEEFRVMATIDRVNTTWTAFQGLTFGCVQCHSHPYEPIPFEDYYSFMAFFNNTEDADLKNEYPNIKFTNNPKERQHSVDLQAKILKLRDEINAPGLLELAKSDSWKSLRFDSLKSTRGTLHHHDGDNEVHALGTHSVRTKHTLTTNAQAFTALRVSIIPQEEDPAKLPERGSVLSQLILTIIKPDGKREQVKIWGVYADSVRGAFDPDGSIRKNHIGFGGYPKLFRRREAVFVPLKPVTVSEGDRLEVALHHSASTIGNQAVTLRRFEIFLSENPTWTKLVTSQKYAAQWTELRKLKAEHGKLKGFNYPIVLERPKSMQRETRTFNRGLWLDKAKKVSTTVPTLLNHKKKPTRTRLEMANWIASADNPLTSRVFVNRIFAELFGTGIVETLGDFGTTGVKPSNLPLLDHLAMEFQSTHQWKLKPLLKEMILSATYRQSNRATAKLAKEDPKNYWLARGPRTRLSAEMIRDNALVASGLISRQVGGPSVMPPQPDGVWQTIYSGAKWKTATGADRYRRGLYTYWRRTSPYPSFLTFDAPSREICTAQRISTNTPLHALITLNDPVYLECAQNLAKKMKASQKSLDEQIQIAHIAVTQQKASNKTLALLNTLYMDFLKEFKAHPEQAKKLAATPEDAATVVLANTIFNLDAAFSK